MDEKTAVKVTNLRKEFILPQHKNASIKQAFVNIAKKNGKVTQTVLDGISFEVEKGDFFGIVGRNGSGKSTMLKILAGVYEPTAGSVELNGKLTPFIELGVGFNPELSGRDNVFLNGALLGFTRKQMQDMYDDIVSFAELEPFMDQKLKNYSSGMQVRLAFSIAIKAKNEILIFDEVLAVGDEAFQRKCLDVFETYKAEKQTVILVTHDMETVRQYCNKALLLDKGEIIEFGNPRKVANKYSKLNQEEIDGDVSKKNEKTESLLKVFLKNQEGRAKVSYGVGDTATVSMSWDGLDGVKSIGVNIFKQSGEHITGANTLKDGLDVQGKKQASINVQLPLQPGKYFVLAEAFAGVGERLDSSEDNPPHFTITKSDVSWSGMIELPHNWTIEN
ncbi:MAG TPA: polysaccharide ABC transporter ATP-binding protein [Candidatus Saccharimonadales bacterium]